MNKKLFQHHLLISITLIISSLALSACSGSSGGTPSLPPPPPPDAPTLNLSVAMKQLQFSWDLVPGATYYRVNENADGVSGFTPVSGDLGAAVITYNHEISVHLQDWPNARYLLEACNASGCTTSNEMNAASSSAKAIGYIKASNSDAGDSFGRAVAISGDGKTLAVGAHGEDSSSIVIDGDQTNNDSTNGAVYVYTKLNTGTWEQQAYIKGSSATANKWFGWDVTLSDDGNTLAVSAIGDGKSVVGSGVVYIYGRDGSNTWSERAIIEASNPENNDRFGYSIALSANGDVLIVGAPLEDSDAIGVDGSNNNLLNSGAAYLHTRDGSGAWSASTFFKASNPGNEIGAFGAILGDQFGWDVDISANGEVIVVGAPNEDSAANTVDGDQADNSLKQSGAAYIFKKETSGWKQKGYLKAANSGGGWSTFCGMIACIDGDQFGYSVSVSGNGNSVAIGAINEESASSDANDNTLRSAGAVYIFTEKMDQTWQQDAYIKTSDSVGFNDSANTIARGDLFGSSIDMNTTGSLLAVGAQNEDGNALGINGDASINSIVQSGAAYLFQKSSLGDWIQKKYIKSSNPDGNPDSTSSADRFGASISLSNDGTVLAIGATGEAGNADTINGDLMDNSALNAGAVYLY